MVSINFSHRCLCVFHSYIFHEDPLFDDFILDFYIHSSWLNKLKKVMLVNYITYDGFIIDRKCEMF